MGPDLNGDGFAELIISAPFSDPNGLSAAGSVTVIYGSPGGLDPHVELDSLEAVTSLVITGAEAGDGLGTSLADAGDINGDGYADLLIGAAFADPLGRPQAGASYLIFGGPDKGVDLLDLSQLTADQGILIAGAQSGDRSGTSLSAAGDLDRDGLGDLLIGAPQADIEGQVDSGAGYLLYGRDLLAGQFSTVDDRDLRSEGYLQAEHGI